MNAVVATRRARRRNATTRLQRAGEATLPGRRRIPAKPPPKSTHQVLPTMSEPVALDRGLFRIVEWAGGLERPPGRYSQEVKARAQYQGNQDEQGRVPDRT